MTDYVKKRALCIKNIYSQNFNKFSFCILNAMKGMGKTTAINYFLELINSKDSITLSPSYDKSFPLHAIANGLGENLSDDVLMKMSSSTVIKKHIIHTFIELLQNKDKTIIVFKDFENFDKETVHFIFEFTEYLINNIKNKTLFFIIELNDEIEYETRNRFARLGKFTNYVQFPGWETDDLSDLLKENYGEFNISEIQMKSIVEYSFENASIFLNNVEFLKERGYAYFQKHSLSCNQFSQDVLLGNYKNVVKNRYDLLNNDLRETLQKASIIGFEFEINSLESAFEVIHAGQKILEIERISRLIFQIDNNQFSFCNKITQEIVETYIPEENRYKWFRILALFYENKMNSTIVQFSDVKYCETALKAAFFFEKAHCFQEAISLYLKTIPVFLNGCFYRQCLICINNTKRLLSDDTFTDIHLKAKLNYFEFICNKQLFDMQQSIVCFNLYKQKVFFNHVEKIKADYEEAYLLYDSNNTQKAYGLLTSCYNELKPIKENSYNIQRLIINVTSLLCSVEETLSLPIFRTHFNEAITLSKKYKHYDLYYSLLRKCGLVFSGKACLKKLKSAANYFNEKNKIEYAMTLHNWGSELIVNMDSFNALHKLNEAYEIFSEYGHNGIVCVKNALAIYYTIFEKDYNYALELLSNYITPYNEDFLLLTVYFNKTTVLRKKGELQKAKEYLQKVKGINEKKRNQFPYFYMFIYAQEGYIHLDEGDYAKAWHCFNKFLHYDYVDRPEYYCSVLRTFEELSKKLGYDYKADIVDCSEKCETLSKKLFEEKIIFCEILFWE